MDRVLPEAKASKYVIKPGDTLSSIAMQKMGNPDFFPLWTHNYETIGSNPNNISVGMVLLIPGVTDEADTY